MFGKKNTGITEAAVRDALSTVIEPELHQDLITLDMVKEITISRGNVGFTVVLTTPACPLRGQIEDACIAAVMTVLEAGPCRGRARRSLDSSSRDGPCGALPRRAPAFRGAS